MGSSRLCGKYGDYAIIPAQWKASVGTSKAIGDKASGKPDYSCFKKGAAPVAPVKPDMTYTRIGDGWCRPAESECYMSSSDCRVGGIKQKFVYPNDCEKSCSEDEKCIGYATYTAKYMGSSRLCGKYGDYAIIPAQWKASVGTSKAIGDKASGKPDYSCFKKGAAPVAPVKPGPVCKQCDCQNWDGSNYSGCTARPHSQCTMYCVQCKDDGITPMPGGWNLHAVKCEEYASGISDMNFAEDLLAELIDALK